MPAMITHEQAAAFAAEWIAAWNAHDLERILSLYTDDFEMRSPKIIHIAGVPTGRLRGKAAVGTYWQQALERRPDLQFRLIEVFAGIDSVCICYESAPGVNAAEWFSFDAEFKIRQAAAHYGSARLK